MPNYYSYFYTFTSENDYLAHHGIKGQKWGVRRYQNEDGTYTDAGKKRREREEYRQLKRERKKRFSEKNIYKMSDQEVKQNLNRLENEKKLKTLRDESLRPGQTRAKEIMKQVGDKILPTLIGGAIMVGLKFAIQKGFGSKTVKKADMTVNGEPSKYDRAKKILDNLKTVADYTTPNIFKPKK